MTLRIHGEGLGNVHLTLTCDVRGCPTSQTFEQDNYVEQRRAATAAGWRETTGVMGRLFYCPTCSTTRRTKEAVE
jgi:hypothetical protein